METVSNTGLVNLGYGIRGRIGDWIYGVTDVMVSAESLGNIPVEDGLQYEGALFDHMRDLMPVIAHDGFNADVWQVLPSTRLNGWLNLYVFWVSKS